MENGREIPKMFTAMNAYKDWTHQHGITVKTFQNYLCCNMVRSCDCIGYCINMETSPLQVKGCKFQAFVQRLWRLSRQGSLSCHTCCNKGPRSFRSHPKDHPIQSPCMTCKGYLETILIRVLRVCGYTNHQHCKLKYNGWSVYKSTRFWGCTMTCLHQSTKLRLLIPPTHASDYIYGH